MPQADSQPPLEVFVGRQPILNVRKEVVAYELLYRSSRENRFDAAGSSSASSNVIANALLTFGLDRLVGNRRAFINSDSALLTDGFVTMLPRNRVVIEILESVVETDELVRACRDLKDKGYTLALDDFVCETGHERLLELADILKVDFRATDRQSQERLAGAYRARGITMLAEKVETPEEFDLSLQAGYQLFQGYFFSRPRIVTSHEIPGFKLNYLRILEETNRPDLDFDRLEEILKPEPSMVHRLLRYVNSAAFGLHGEVRSIRHALALLGEQEIRRWAVLAAFAGLAEDKPRELIVAAVVRGRVCERLAAEAGLGQRGSEMFLMGMFSLADAILERSMEDVFSCILLVADVRETLLHARRAPVRIRLLLDLAIALEHADWPAMETAAATLGLPIHALRDVYLEALEWTARVFRD